MRRALCTAVVFLVTAGCFSGYEDKRDAALRVRRGTFVQTLVLTGELDAERGTVVSVPQLPSWQNAIKWLANDGDAVRAGDRIAELDNTAFANDLDNKRQLATQAEQELQQKEAEWSADVEQKRLDLDKKNGEFQKAKLEAAVPRDIVSARDYEDRQTKLHRAEVESQKSLDVLRTQQKAIASDRSTAQLKLARAQRDVETAEKAIDALLLRAPRDGVIVIRDHPWEGRKLQAGDMVWIGMPIAQLPEIESMQVVASLADVDDGRIAVGMPATVTVDGYPSNRFGGRVSSISAVAQEGTRNMLRRVFRVVVKLDRVDVARMRPGLSARVEVRRQATPGVLLAPRASIDFSTQTPRVRLASGKLVLVKIGACNAQDCVIATGLKEGQRLGTAAQEAQHG
jgi:HlyD family secretion protein